MMSYLIYLDNPTPANIKEVHKKMGLSQPKMANIAKIGLPTYKGWLAPTTNTNHRTPPTPAWNLFIYELEARRLGFDDLQDFFKNFDKSV